MLPCTAATAQSDIAAAHVSPTLYYPSAIEEARDREALHARVVPEVQALSTAQTSSLIAELDRAENLISSLQTHGAFLKIYTLEDTQDQAVKKAQREVRADQAVLESAMEERLRRVSASEFASLGRYTFLAKAAQRDTAHALSPDAERYRATVVGSTLSSISDAYDRIDESLKGSKDIRSDDPVRRRAALATLDQAYDAAAPEEAAMLGCIVALENRDAVAQGYLNAADRKYQLRGLSDALVQQTLAAVRSEAPVYRHYQQVLASHAAKTLHVSSVLSAEVNLASAKPPVISLPQARELILAGLRPLGTDYTNRLAALLDPANGRLDLVGGAHRAQTGTSIDAYEAPTVLYYNGYDGTLRGVSTIAHEGGHAIHRELMNAGGAPIYERSGPSFLFEGYAIFNELLLLDHATHVARTLQDRAYALERLLAKLSLELFVSAEEADFERSLYTEATGKPLLDRTKVDALYQASIAAYELWPMQDVGQSRGWMRKALLFEDPLYLINYLYASVIAVALYEKSHTDPNFAAKYEALLRRGFDAEPQVLLASIGVRLDDPDLVKPAARLLAAKTQELQEAYAAERSN